MDNFGEGLSPLEYQKATVATQAERVATFQQNNPNVALPAVPEIKQKGVKPATGETANEIGGAALMGAAAVGSVIEHAIVGGIVAALEQKTPDAQLKILAQRAGEQQKPAAKITAIGEAMQPVTPEATPAGTQKSYSLSEWIDLPLSQRQEITKQAVENKPAGMTDETHTQYVENVIEAQEVTAAHEAQKQKEQSATDRYGEYMARVLGNTAAETPQAIVPTPSIGNTPRAETPQPSVAQPKPLAPLAKAA